MARMSDLEIIKRYEKVRRGGKYNMIADSNAAMEEANLAKDEYFYAINHYGRLIELLDDSEDYGF